MENHNSIMKIHKSVTFRKLHNSKLWSSIIRIMELHKRLSSLVQHRMMYICVQSMPFLCQSYHPPRCPHAVFQCKDQDYKFVIYSMSDSCMQFCWKCVLESKQNFKLTYFPKYSIFLLKHSNCTDGRAQSRAKIPRIHLVFYGKSPVETDLT